MTAAREHHISCDRRPGLVATRSTLALVVGLSGGCYGKAPPVPPTIPLPELAGDAHLAVRTDTVTKLETVDKQATSCPTGQPEGSPSCVITRYRATEPVTRTITVASLGDQPLTYAQFKVITDPQWNYKLTHLAELSQRCERANVPRYLGLALLFGGLVVADVFRGKPGEVAVYAGAAGGTASYAAGYFWFGGADCSTADELYRELDLRDAMRVQRVEGAGHAEEMRALADRFNASRPSHGAALDMRRGR